MPGPTPIPTPAPVSALAPTRAAYDHVHPAAEKPSKPTPKDVAGEGAKSSVDSSRWMRWMRKKLPFRTS